MEDCERLRREYQIAILEHQNHILDSALFPANRNRSIKVTYGDVSKSLWRFVNVDLGEAMDRKATEFGIYDQLMMELRNEDPASITNFLRMPPDMFEELLDRVGPRTTKMHTRYRESLCQA